MGVWSFFFKKKCEIASNQEDEIDKKDDILQTEKDNMKDNQWVVNGTDSVTLAEEVINALEDAQTPLVNKYLYLGPHGARAWEAVENSGGMLIREHAKILLNTHLDSILDAIQKDSGDNGLDVVSLGTGTGNDDKRILQKLWERDPTKIAFFAVDLGRELLHRAMKNINDSFKRQTERKKATSLHPICIDISKLSSLQTYFRNHKSEKHRKRLYHLLGLTLGNNNEFTLLSQISKGMLSGDYLLIGVDFCVGDDFLTAQSKKSYEDSEWEVDDFVSGPLKTAVALVRNAKRDKNFDGIFVTPSGDQCNFMDEKFQIVKKTLTMANQQESGLSCVPGSLSIARYYVPSIFVKDKFDAFDPTKRTFGKLCDFSNKYNATAFEEWLRNHQKELGLTLMHDLDKIKMWGYESQYLVLLKKTNQPFNYAEEQHYNTILKNVDRIFSTYQESGDSSIYNEALNLQTELRKDNGQKMIATLKTYLRESTLPIFPKNIKYQQKAEEYLKKVRQIYKGESF